MFFAKHHRPRNSDVIRIELHKRHLASQIPQCGIRLVDAALVLSRDVLQYVLRSKFEERIADGGPYFDASVNGSISPVLPRRIPQQSADEIPNRERPLALHVDIAIVTLHCSDDKPRATRVEDGAGVSGPTERHGCERPAGVFLDEGHGRISPHGADHVRQYGRRGGFGRSIVRGSRRSEA